MHTLQFLAVVLESLHVTVSAFTEESTEGIDVMDVIVCVTFHKLDICWEFHSCAANINIISETSKEKPKKELSES